MNSSNSNMFSIQKLTGRDNFATWKFSVRTYLEHEDLWHCVDGDHAKPIDASKDVKARTKLILLLDPQNYIHVQDCKTAKEVWQSLERAFDDNGLTRRVGLLRDLINTNLESSTSVEDYVSKIMSTAHKLRNIGFEVNDEWLGTLMLAGLPEMYKPMIMGLENSGATISADLVKTKLMQEIKSSEPSGNSAAFYSKSKTFKPQLKTKGPRCYSCNQYGHIAKFCRTPKRNNAEQNKGDKSGFIAAFSATIGENSNKWYIDSGASMHMTNRKDWMYNVTEPPKDSITAANKKQMAVKAMGAVDISLPGNKVIQVRNVLYVPGLAANLLSVSTIVNNGFKITFNNKGCEVYDCSGKYLCSATLFNKLYSLNVEELSVHLTSTDEAANNNCILWHNRMGHLNFSDVNKLPDCTEGVTLAQSKSNVTIICPSCLEGKQTRQSFNNIGSRATKPLELIHSDVCGPMENLSYGDNGKEYCNSTLQKYLSHCGITHQTSTPYTPQQNGLAERMNRTLVERARSMICHANLDKRYWAESIATAAYVVNRSPTRSLGDKTPYEMWSGKRPNLSHLRIFGCEAMVHVPKERRLKWDSKSNKMIFVGYCDNTKGYRLMDPKSHKVIKSRDVVFLEKSNNCHTMPSCEKSKPENDDKGACSTGNVLQDNMSKESTDRQTPDISNSPRISVEQDSHDSSEYETDAGDHDETYYPSCSVESDCHRNITLRPRNRFYDQNGKTNFFCLMTNLTDPQTVEEALSSVNATEWKKAMDEEYKSLIENNTWSLADLPAGKKTLPCKWVFKSKTDQKGNIIKFKARLVIKGYAQKMGIDYGEIYSPVVRYTSIRYLFALSVKYNLYIDQMDAVSAFLQGEIDAEIYMTQPQLYEEGSQVCHLHKSLYGLKQASRLWNIKLDKTLKDIGLQRSQTDPCIYFDSVKKIFIAVWVDDLILFSSQKDDKNMIKEKLKLHFKMKDLGEASQCIGLNITKADGKIMLDQQKYIKETLHKFGMQECKPVRTPIEVSSKFETTFEGETESNFPYQQAIGCLLYIAQDTRPDISYAVNTLSRFNKNPKLEHWVAVKRVLRYLQGTKDFKLTYSRDCEEEIIGYCDADWASDINDRKSCTGYVFMLQGGAISWCSRKQQTVALSTAEAEYMSMASAAQEALWLKQLQTELGQSQGSAITIYSDNQSAIRLSTSDCYLPRTKHIDIRYHFLKNHVNNNEIIFSYMKGNLMIADVLTKGTVCEKNILCVKGMGLHSGRVL